MRSRNNQTLQFKIVLKGTKPPIWRRIVIPSNYTFWDFHVAIQDAMGWLDTHLHRFDIVNPIDHSEARVACYDDEYGEDLLPSYLREHPGILCASSRHFGLASP